MSSIEVRPFRRSDGEQLTQLMKAHAAAVVPADGRVGACASRLERWEVSGQYADGALPVPGVYGVPAQWPHVRALYERAGFEPAGHTEVIFLARVDELARPARAPLPGLE